MSNCLVNNNYNNDIKIPNNYDKYFIRYAENIIDWKFVKAIGWCESRLEPLAESDKGAYGIMQITLIACRQIFCGWEYILDPAYNIKYGCQYINWLLVHYGLNKVDLLIGYNWGIGNLLRVKKEYGINYFKHIPEETKKYIKDVRETYILLSGIDIYKK